MVDIREWYQDKDSGDLKPGKKGISLPMAQWFVVSLSFFASLKTSTCGPMAGWLTFCHLFLFFPLVQKGRKLWAIFPRLVRSCWMEHLSNYRFPTWECSMSYPPSIPPIPLFFGASPNPNNHDPDQSLNLTPTPTTITTPISNLWQWIFTFYIF